MKKQDLYGLCSSEQQLGAICHNYGHFRPIHCMYSIFKGHCTLIKKKRKFRGIGCKVIYDYNDLLMVKIFMHFLIYCIRNPFLMTLHPNPSEFPYKSCFFFQCTRQYLLCTAGSHNPWVKFSSCFFLHRYLYEIWRNLWISAFLK